MDPPPSEEEKKDAPADPLASAEAGTNDGLDQSLEVIQAPRFEDAEPTIVGFKDHFTLPLPSSTVRYRETHSAARIIEGESAQFVLEETYDPKEDKHEVSIRRIHDTSEGVRFLRASYAIVCAFFTGFLFVFCLQVLLFLVLDLAIEFGATSQQAANYGAALGVVLSIIPFVYGLSSALVIAGAYILDTWRGHFLIRNFTFRRVDQVTVEWMFFFFFLGLPIFVMGITLLIGTDQWWVITSLLWFSCVLIFYVIFCANVVWYEMRACWEISRNRFDDDDDSFWHVLKRSILLRQVAHFSGQKHVSYLSLGSIQDAEYTDKGSRRSNMVVESRREKIGWRAKLTNWNKLSTDGGLGLYQHLDTPERFYTIDDARDVRPYVTSHTWSLEKIFCRPRDSRYIAIVKGPGAVTRAQMKSTLICSIVGTFLIFFLLTGVCVYLDAGPAFTGFMVAAGIIIALPGFWSTYRLYKVSKQLIFVKRMVKGQGADTDEPDDEQLTFVKRVRIFFKRMVPGQTADEDEPNDPLVITQADRTHGIDDAPILDSQQSEGIYLTWESYRINRATDRLCWIMFTLEVTLFFIWPLISLFRIGNYPGGILFFIVAGFSGLRYYINAAVVLEETGHMDLVDGKDEKEVWKNQARLNEIVGNITRGRSRGAWMSVLGVVGFVFVALLLGAIGGSTESTFNEPYTYLDDFVYVQKDSLRYPTCELTSDLGDSPLTSMADYAYLAGLAYRTVNSTQTELDGWFGPSGLNATNQADTVATWRMENNIQAAVVFKLVTVGPNDFAFVLIRGTQNQWDMLTDAQLWSAAALMQILRALLPFGEMWTPIIPNLINVITVLEAASLDKVSFYKVTTRFVQYLLSQPEGTYLGVAVTGHSLGGGLSIITGAQTDQPAVALSGPNALLSRLSFDPPVSEEELDSKTFNIIPERDLVPKIDDVAQNWQSIRCEAKQNDFIGCHDSTRSLCEIIYTCGTGDRPALCECVTLFGYPQPMLKPGSPFRTFEEACGLN